MGCDAVGVPTAGVNPTLTDKLSVVWCRIVGYCDPDDELIPSLDSDISVVVVVDDGEQSTSNNSVVGRKDNNGLVCVLSMQQNEM